jgi:hypothetical protein
MTDKFPFGNCVEFNICILDLGEVVRDREVTSLLYRNNAQCRGVVGFRCIRRGIKGW